MFRKYFCTSALLSLALVLLVTDVAQAQRVRDRRMERREARRGLVVATDTAPLATTTTMRGSFYYAPEVIQGDRTGHIQVMVPNAQAKIWIDDTLTTQTGTERWYHTPALTVGATSNYRIRATWIQDGREVTREQVVPVMPGRTLVVNFTTR